jgi:hypothetical protein
MADRIIVIRETEVRRVTREETPVRVVVRNIGPPGPAGPGAEDFSALADALSQETSVRINRDDILSNAISVVSQAISAVSNNLSHTLSAVSALSVVAAGAASATASETSNRISADNALSNAVSVVSQAVSVEATARATKDDALSNAMSVASVTGAERPYSVPERDQ